MSQKYIVIQAAVEFWTNLISQEIDRFKHENKIDVMPNYIQRKYNFPVKLDNFREDLSTYLYEEYPKTVRSEIVLLTCIGAPSGALRQLIKGADLDPHLLSGKIIEMEIAHSYAKVCDRKANTEIDLTKKKTKKLTQELEQ
ncbi:MAG: hypothetical protein MR024_01055 [Firmicutes bacterium]|nr:hypothetical protein [Bacillota bacterium]